MSAAPLVSTVIRAAGTGREFRHRLWLTLGAVAAVVVTLALIRHGFDYYRLPAGARPFTAQHAELKPGGRLGHTLGITGGCFLLLMYVYALRKKSKWLSAKGKTKHWLDYHILMGLTAPVLVTFHASFKFGGIAGAAYWVMMAVVASGIVGRYFYRGIPRRLDNAEMSLDEMQQASADLSRQVHEAGLISREEWTPLVELPTRVEVQAMALPKALAVMIWLDLRRAYRLRKLRLRAGAHVTDRAELVRALASVKAQAALSKDILFLGKMRNLFHLWHVIHKPFSYSFAILATLHVLAVVFLGYL